MAKFHKHPRLKGRDYTRGTFFVTLCTEMRIHAFGNISGTDADARMELNDMGHIVDECWCAIPDHFPQARLEETQIMPNHLHAILTLAPAIVQSTHWVDATSADATDAANAPKDPTSRPKGPPSGSLGAIIGAFKSETTKRVNRMLGRTGIRLWQLGFHDRVIRQYGGEYERIAQYIAENPANWQ